MYSLSFNAHHLLTLSLLPSWSCALVLELQSGGVFEDSVSFWHAPQPKYDLSVIVLTICIVFLLQSFMRIYSLSTYSGGGGA